MHPAPLLAGIVTSVVSSVLSALARGFTSGITSLASWAIGGLAHAASATTAINLNTWFQGPWRAMTAVAVLAAVPLFLAGVLESLVHGEGVGGLGRVVGRLLAASFGSVIALGLVQLLLSLVDVSCELVERGSGISMSAALARLGIALGVTALARGGTAAAIGALLLAIIAALAALVLWLELAMRSVLILVATAFLPLGLAGLLWPRTASWLRRIGEILAAIAISKLVIVVVLILGAAALTASPIALNTPGADIDAMVQGVAFLGLATLGLPIALRVVPFAAEAALSPGRGGMLLRGGYGASRLAAGVNSTSTLLNRVRGHGKSDSAEGSGGESSSGSPGGSAGPRPGGGSTGGPSNGSRGPRPGGAPAGGAATPPSSGPASSGPASSGPASAASKGAGSAPQRPASPAGGSAPGTGATPSNPGTTPPSPRHRPPRGGPRGHGGAR